MQVNELISFISRQSTYSPPPPVYKNIETMTSLHHRFVLYYDHFEGDVEACLCLYNSYLAKRMWILEREDKKKAKKEKHHNGGVFTLENAVNFCQRFDDYCASQIERVLTIFQNPSHRMMANQCKLLVHEKVCIQGKHSKL